MMMDVYMNGLIASEEENSARNKRQSSSTNTMELMVYIDAEVQNDASQNGFSVIEYILGIINMVSDIAIFFFNNIAIVAVVQMARLYRDPTLQHQIDLTLTRIILEGLNVRKCTLH